MHLAPHLEWCILIPFVAFREQNCSAERLTGDRPPRRAANVARFGAESSRHVAVAERRTDTRGTKRQRKEKYSADLEVVRDSEEHRPTCIRRDIRDQDRLSRREALEERPLPEIEVCPLESGGAASLAWTISAFSSRLKTDMATPVMGRRPRNGAASFDPTSTTVGDDITVHLSQSALCRASAG